jgi:hypothetical protein
MYRDVNQAVALCHRMRISIDNRRRCAQIAA